VRGFPIKQMMKDKVGTLNVIDFVLSKNAPKRFYDIPESDILIPNSKVPLRKLFKLNSISMTNNEFVSRFLKWSSSNRYQYRYSSTHINVGTCFEEFVNSALCGKHESTRFVSICRLDNGFCYAKLISSSKCVAIIYFNANMNEFELYFPVRGNNYNYYLDSPLTFTENDEHWIKKQIEGTDFAFNDPIEAKSYFFISNEMIDDEIKNYSRILDEETIEKSGNEKDRNYKPDMLRRPYKMGEYW
jgi:hypothetical protein